MTIEYEQQKQEEMMEKKKELKKKESKINGLQDRLKKAEEMNEVYKSQIASLEYNLNFYKMKLQQ